MNPAASKNVRVPLEQQAIRDKCFHPSGTFVEFPMADIETSIPACFERIAQECADRIAVQDGDNKWTYAQLDHLSNQMARVIHTRVGFQKQPVALFLGDRWLTVAAMLAVLKSANFYVVMDVSYPVERVSYMLADSTAKVVLTESKHRDLVDSLAIGGVETIEVDTIGAEVSGENLNLALSPLDYAFMVYTSGSSGYPKGVIHNQRNVLFSAFIETNDMHISRDDRVGVNHSFSSSASTKYMYAALLNGAVLVTFDVSRWGVDGLRSWLIRERVTLCDFAVSLFRALACTLQNAGNFPALRVVILGSEAATAEDVALYKRLFHPKSILIILFATSETAAIRRYFIEPQGVVSAGAVPVGYPVEGKSVLLVDEAGDDLGIGRNGQIAVRSRYLAVGYWRQPVLTGAKFLSAACDGGDERTYLTGDLGRLGDHGCLFHLGRKDHQVNIRGYTIETLEIEHRLLRHPAVKAAAVVDRVSDAGEPILVGYYVPSSDAVPKADALGRFLRESLPSHMVPAKLVMLDALPLTPNGKIDRRMLPDPGRRRPALETAYAGPETEIETRLVEIWSAVLSLDAIGIHDNFFDLGGHSLAASRVISRVIQAFKLDVPLKALLDAPTIAQMAKVIAHADDPIALTELDRLLSEIEAMPEDEARKQVREKNLGGKT